MSINTHESHPHANIFPLHGGPPLSEFSARIKAYGQRDPLVLLDGKILDGRRRELACFEAEVEPSYRLARAVSLKELHPRKGCCSASVDLEAKEQS